MQFCKKITAVIVGSAVLFCACSGKSNSLSTNATTETSAPNEVEVVTFNADSAYARVAEQVAMGPRVPGSDANAKLGRYIVDYLKRNGADTVLIQRTNADVAGKSTPIVNIMGRYGVDRLKRVILLAHYDTRPIADEDPDEAKRSRPIDGANDGASGTGVLLEIARIMGEQMPDSIGVDILFVDAEDSGDSGNDDSWCIGTKEWVKQMPYKIGMKPRFGILLDMVGGRNAVFHREYFSEQAARSINDKVWSRAAVSGFGSRFPNEVGIPVVDDHVPLIKAGIPTIDIIENRNPSTSYFNPTWHTHADNMSNIDKETLGVVGQVVVNTLYNEK